MLAATNTDLINPEDITETLIPSKAGVILNPKILKNPENMQKLSARIKLASNQHYRNLAVAVHYFNDKFNLIGQDDFDLGLYTDHWLQRKKNRQRYHLTGRIKILKNLSIPDKASFLRISLYNPGRDFNFFNLYNDSSDFVKL